MGTEQNDRQQFVNEKMRAGWTKGALKAAMRRQFGPMANSELERLFREAKASFEKATESDPELAAALDLYARWVDIGNLVNAQIRARERLHKALGIPSPAEMLRLERDWATSPQSAREAAELITARSKNLMNAIQQMS